jgi:hypothetical protein
MAISYSVTLAKARVPLFPAMPSGIPAFAGMAMRGRILAKPRPQAQMGRDKEM